MWAIQKTCTPGRSSVIKMTIQCSWKFLSKPNETHAIFCIFNYRRPEFQFKLARTMTNRVVDKRLFSILLNVFCPWERKPSRHTYTQIFFLKALTIQSTCCVALIGKLKMSALNKLLTEQKNHASLMATFFLVRICDSVAIWKPFVVFLCHNTQWLLNLFYNSNRNWIWLCTLTSDIFWVPEF